MEPIEPAPESLCCTCVLFDRGACQRFLQVVEANDVAPNELVVSACGLYRPTETEPTS